MQCDPDSSLAERGERPPLGGILDRVWVVSLPMRLKFRGLTARELVLIEGPAGWGEFGPFPEYGDAEAVWWLRSAMEMAWQGPPTALRDRVPVNATVPAVAAGEVAAVLDRFPGCDTVKVKVAERGQSLADDMARVAAVLQARPGVKVRIDANGGWSVQEALGAVSVLDQAVRAADAQRVSGAGPVPLTGPGLEYVEQPCATVEELIDLRERFAAAGLDVPVAADESIRRADDPLRVVRAGGADRAVLKAAPLGGPRRLLRVAAELGVPVTVSSALDSAVGMAAGLAAAAALPADGLTGSAPASPCAAGLGTGGFFVEDVVDPSDGFELVDGRIVLRTVVPDVARLEALVVGGERRDWWLDRLSRCYDLL